MSKDMAIDPATVKRLEDEGDIAADYLEALLDIADIDGDIEIDVENDRASVEIISEEGGSSLERLVGSNGEVLESLQELTRLAVKRSTGERTWLMLDIAGYRADRKRELADIAQEGITVVKTTGEAFSLRAMNPFERKVCHDVVAQAGLFSESEGREPNRRVVILPEAAAEETEEPVNEEDDLFAGDED